MFNLANIKKTWYYLQKNGIAETYYAVKERLYAKIVICIRIKGIGLNLFRKQNWIDREEYHLQINIHLAFWFPCMKQSRNLQGK